MPPCPPPTSILGAMTEKSHEGSCHCGAVKYRVTLDLDAPALVCNCSMCRRSGSMLMFTPPEKFELVSGEESLTDYRFRTHVIHHLFCKTCGIKSFARGTSPKGDPVVAINVRCLSDVDVFTQPTQPFQGKDA
jgi:hypothetical protein